MRQSENFSDTAPPESMPCESQERWLPLVVSFAEVPPGREMWQAHPFQRINGQLVSRLLRSTFDLRTNMILKAFSAPSATLHGTTMRRGADTIMAGTEFTCFTS